VLRSPLDDHPKHSRRNVTADNNQRLNINDCFVLTLLGVKMRRHVVAKIHLNADAKEPANLRHAGSTHAT
jgi:hypothetical protein